MTPFILYGTLGCHLCEVAEAQIAALLESLHLSTLEIECLDIVDSDELLAVYGERIPVLRRVLDGAEIAWPFADEALRDLLQGGAASVGASGDGGNA
jgi:Glutaredoxin-like domain (DUF836)